MAAIAIICSHCTKLLPKNLMVVNCETFKNFYHVKCCGVTQSINPLKNANLQCRCQKCLTSKNIPEHLRVTNCDNLHIALLSKHIDELRSLLTILKHTFDVIGITETRLHDESPLVNLGIEGYGFKHKPTNQQHVEWQACFNFEAIQNLSKSIDDVSKSLVIEIKRWP